MSFTSAPAPVAETSLTNVDAAIDALHAKKDPWLEVSVADRIALLEGCIQGIHKVAPRWVEIGAAIKGLTPDENLAGEEWLAGPMPTMRNARLLIEALRHNGEPPTPTRTRDDGHVAARVFPRDLMDRLMFAGITADVWIQKGKPASQGAIYRSRVKGTGRVCLVLGGGNVSSIPPMDALYKLFVEDEVVLLKMNPVNEALGPVLADALEPLVSGGWLQIVYGGAEVGAHASSHPKVTTLHITGSDRTYDAIVWGPEEGRDERKRAGAVQNTRPFSAELGCVTPVLVVPGPWSASDLRFQAEHVAAMITQNASFNCNAAKAVILAREWLQRDAFLAELAEQLARAPARKAYYPGARQRYDTFLSHYPSAQVLGEARDDSIPWTLIADVSGDDYALSHEAFCGVVAIVEVSAPDFHGVSVPHFLERAVTLANERLWGTLSACVLAHPMTQETYEAELRLAIEELRYGAIGLNVWPGAIYALASPSWGAYPGHTPEDIQSGVGVVHNALMFDHVEKTVVTAPFRIRPKPAWFGSHKNLLELGRRLVDFEAHPSWGALLKVALAAMKG